MKTKKATDTAKKMSKTKDNASKMSKVKDTAGKKVGMMTASKPSKTPVTKTPKGMKYGVYSGDTRNRTENTYDTTSTYKGRKPLTKTVKKVAKNFFKKI